MPCRKVLRIEFPTPQLMALFLEREDLTFVPGDCVAISNAKGVSRPYSIASGVDDAHLRFLIRLMPGGELSTWLATLKMGDDVEFSQPFGWFRPGQSGQSGERSVFVATGTGISPFVSFLRSRPEAQPELCLYGVRRAEDAVDLAFLEARCATLLCISRESVPGRFQGRVTDQVDKIPLNENVHYYLCGLDAMIDDVSTWLETNGIHFSHIHREVFFNA